MKANINCQDKDVAMDWTCAYFNHLFGVAYRGELLELARSEADGSFVLVDSRKQHLSLHDDFYPIVAKKRKGGCQNHNLKRLPGNKMYDRFLNMPAPTTPKGNLDVALLDDVIRILTSPKAVQN